MKTQLKDVTQFMSAYGQEVPGRLQPTTEQLRYFRYALINEEAQELLDSENIVEYADAVVDLLYVTLGAAVAAGISGDVLVKCWDEVHKSNMSKFWSPEDAYGLSKDHLVEPAGAACPGKYVVKKNGKVIKSPSYSKANLEQFLK